jgi:hypothetical protein
VEDCVALTELVEVIVLQHPTRMMAYPAGLADLFQLLVSLLWHPSWNVRKAASSVVSRFHSADLSLSEALFEGFCAWIPVLDEQFNAHKTSDAVEAGTDSSTVQSGIAGEFLAKALIVVVNAALACKPPICSRLFLLCHHPCITRGRQKDIIWKVETNLFSLCAM